LGSLWVWVDISSKKLYPGDYIVLGLTGITNGGLPLECRIWNTAGEYLLDLIDCSGSLEEIIINPVIEDNGEYNLGSFVVSFHNFLVPTSFTTGTGIWAEVRYNDDVVALTSTLKAYPPTDGESVQTAVVTALATMDDIGMRSELALTFTTDVAIDQCDSIYVSLSEHYSEGLSDGHIHAEIDGVTVECMLDYTDLRTLVLYSLPSSYKAG